MTARVACLVAFVLACTGCNPSAAIEVVFHRHGPAVVDQALEVAECESGMNPEARNGQFLGLYQMGHWHYWRFGDGDWRDPLVNALAAEGLWKDSGGSWRPWACAPGRAS